MTKKTNLEFGFPMARMLSKGAMILAAAFALSCAPEQLPNDDENKENEDPGNVDTPVNPDDTQEVIPEGVVRLYLNDASVRNAFGVGVTEWGKVQVNGTEYQSAVNDAGKVYVDVPVVEGVTSYSAVLAGSSSDWWGETPDKDIIHPFAYAYHQAEQSVSSFPLFAQAQASGQKADLDFKSGCAVLKLKITGDASVASIKVKEPAGAKIAGVGSYASGAYTISKGTDFVVLNTTNKGNFVQLSGAGAEFLIPIAAGQYGSGLEVTVCTADHKMSRTVIPAFSVSSDEVYTKEIAHKADSDLIYYEGFDNFVWGGDIVGGNETLAMLPKSEKVTTSSFKSLTGYETPLYQTECTMAGAGYVQKSSTLSDIAGKIVEDSRNLSASYVRSRNVGDYTALFRVQEHQGYISVGASDSYNGIFEPTLAGTVITMQKDLTISFDFCPKADFNDDLYFVATNGANIVSCSIDGVELSQEAFTRVFSKTGSTGKIFKSAVEIPADMTAKNNWHRISITVRNVNDASTFKVTTPSSNSKAGSYGFYLDNFEIRAVYDASMKRSSTLRVLYWNIQNGMWADQNNNYNNFVAWVKKYNPDVCVWCEGETIFDMSGNKVYGANRVLPNAWASVAARYGHNYMSKGADKDNYPQIITSKYSISTLEQIYETSVADSPVAHGAGHFSINFGGTEVRIISFHAYAQAYHPKYEGKTDEEKAASSALFEGDYHRLHEIKHVCDNVINASANSSVTNWLLMGDFNAVSRVDAEHYTTDPNSTVYLLHDYLLANTYMKDIIAERNAPEDYFSSINGDTRRIDYMYASPAMYDRIQSAAILIDSWTVLSQDKSVTSGYFCRPSDHRPILVDFKMN